MNYEHLRERTLEMVDDATMRCLAYGETVDCTDCVIALVPTEKGMMLGAIIHVSLKGPILGKTVGNSELVPDVGLLAHQKNIDNFVRSCLEQIRKTITDTLAEVNGHASSF